MSALIDRRFEEWTRGKDPVEARVSIFERIRDIPYAVNRETLDPEKGAEEMLRRNCGSCQPKHRLLGDMFERLGIPVFYVIYRFRWDDLGIDYPQHLQELSKRMPVTRHLSCRAMIGDELVQVDATCDLPLERTGATVNRAWDGFSGLVLPFPHLEEEGIYHSSEKTTLAFPAFSTPETEFYKSLNRWLDEVRSNPDIP